MTQASTAPIVLRYRIVVVLLACGYTAYQLGTGYWAAPGGPMRYLTNWALIGSAVASLAMVAFSMGWLRRPPFVLASVVAVMNAMVVIQYWRLYLEDPSLVTANGSLAWWKEYYLHLLGPLLQWVDALFLFGAFHRHIRSMLALCLVVLAYTAWAELFVGPMNARPVGSVTSGLPYPFLNNMDLSDRLVFYGINLVAALGLYGMFAWIARGVRRLRPQAGL